MICLPNFGDEIAIAELVGRAKLNVPILLQASNDEVDKVSISQRRDAFCGKISVTNNFYQYGVRFSKTTTHTCDTFSAELVPTLNGFPACAARSRACAALDWRPSGRGPGHSRPYATAKSCCRRLA